jgi:hypothetical protein
VGNSARLLPYPASGCNVRIPESLWHGALATVQEYAKLGSSEFGEPGSEALLYLGGAVIGEEMIVSGLYRLNHAPQGDRVAATPDEARWLVRTLRARDEKLVCQLHSHRGRAGHSPGDDAWATSFHEGFFSIVVPRFGEGVTEPAECAILEYLGGKFVELERAEIERRIRVYPEIAERVPTSKPAPTRGRKEGAWRRFAERLRSIAPKPR